MKAWPGYPSKMNLRLCAFPLNIRRTSRTPLGNLRYPHELFWKLIDLEEWPGKD